MGEVLADCYRTAFSADTFHSYFECASFAEGQNPDSALAEWHGFGTFSYTYCLWIAYEDQDVVFPILDVFQPGLLESLRLNQLAERYFLEIVTERQNEYLRRYQEINDSSSMQRFYGRVVSHITGRSAAALDEVGIPQIADASCAAALCHYHTAVMIETRELIAKLSR